MKHFILILPLLTSLYSFGQFAITSDKDGYTYIREKGAIDSKIIDSLKNGHLIYCFENAGNWINIDYTAKGKERNGYIYNNRVKFISDFNTFSIVNKTANAVTLLKDSIEIIVTESNFNKNKHHFKYHKENKDQIELIDNKQYWGTDGGMPKTQYQSITIKLGNKIIQLPQKATDNLFEPSLYTAQVNYDNHKNIIYIQSMNSDGAGAYEVIWKIENGVYKERFITYGF